MSQIGLDIHGKLPRERDFIPGLWGLRLYHDEGSVAFGGRSFPFRLGNISVAPSDTELVWRFPAEAPHHYALMRFPEATANDAVGPASARQAT